RITGAPTVCYVCPSEFDPVGEHKFSSADRDFVVSPCASPLSSAPPRPMSQRTTTASPPTRATTSPSASQPQTRTGELGAAPVSRAVDTSACLYLLYRKSCGSGRSAVEEMVRMNALLRSISVETLTAPEIVYKLARNHFLIPTFQRDFVWKPPDVLALWDSMYRSFPIGSILCWLTD